MSYRVLSVAYPFTPVGLNNVGGSEQILTLLDRALVRAGHSSMVVAVEGSHVDGTLAATPKWPGTLDEKARKWGRKQHKKVIEQALRGSKFDLIHMHSLDFYEYLPKGSTPVLATLHLPPDWYPAHVYDGSLKVQLNCVSASQRRRCPRKSGRIPVVDNGIDVSLFSPSDTKKNMVLALGRICPEKGYHLALDAARLAGVEMVLAGELIDLAPHKEYFRDEIAPRLDAKRRFIGPVGLKKKRELLREAKCLLIPSLVAETSSLVAMEALASGTPVVAFPSGALGDIVTHGKTGFVVADEVEMAEAIKRVSKIRAGVCRATAVERFSAEHMFAGYMDLYDRIVEDSTSSVKAFRPSVQFA